MSSRKYRLKYDYRDNWDPSEKSIHDTFAESSKMGEVYSNYAEEVLSSLPKLSHDEVVRLIESTGLHYIEMAAEETSRVGAGSRDVYQKEVRKIVSSARLVSAAEMYALVNLRVIQDGLSRDVVYFLPESQWNKYFSAIARHMGATLGRDNLSVIVELMLKYSEIIQDEELKDHTYSS